MSILRIQSTIPCLLLSNLGYLLGLLAVNPVHNLSLGDLALRLTSLALAAQRANESHLLSRKLGIRILKSLHILSSPVLNTESIIANLPDNVLERRDEVSSWLTTRRSAWNGGAGGGGFVESGEVGAEYFSGARGELGVWEGAFDVCHGAGLNSDGCLIVVRDAVGWRGEVDGVLFGLLALDWELWEGNVGVDVDEFEVADFNLEIHLEHAVLDEDGKLDFELEGGELEVYDCGVLRDEAAGIEVNWSVVGQGWVGCGEGREGGEREESVEKLHDDCFCKW